MPGSERGVVRRPTWDLAAGVTLFLVSGLAFIVLSCFAGVATLTAGGIGVPVSAGRAALLSAAAVGIWILGLAMAVGGLVYWIQAGRRQLRFTTVAGIDLVVQSGLIAVFFLLH